MVKWIEHRPCVRLSFQFFGVQIPVWTYIGIFLQDFIISATLAPSGPLSGESTFHYHQLKNNWLAQFPCFHHEMSVCKFVWRMCVVEACFGLSIAGVTCVGCVPFPSNYASLPCMQGPWCDMSANEFPIGGSLVCRVT